MEFVTANLISDQIQCRACTLEMNKFEMFSLYNNEPNLSHIFMQCTSIEISESDDLPDYLCPDCNYQLIQLNEFRQKCSTSDAFFRQQNLLKIVKIENDVESTLNYNETAILDLNIETLDPKLEIKKVDDDRSEIDSREADSYQDDQPKFNKSKIKDATGGAGFYCDICNTKFLAKHRIEGHLRQHVGLDPYLCRVCNASYKTWESYAKHKKNCHDSENETHSQTTDKYIKLFCKICGKMFYNQLRLEGHLRQHEGHKGFQCKICSKEYSRIQRLNKHYTIEHNQNGTMPEVACTFPGCQKTFKCSENLRNHTRYHHGKDGDESVLNKRRCVCDVCGKTLSSKFQLKEHSYVHTGEKPYKCDRCPKKYSSNKQLKLHLLRHDNIKNFICTICGAKKITNNELQKHLNTHTKAKTWPCPLCPLICTSYNNSNRHMRVFHLGIKSYKCPHCERTFGKADTLKHHVMTHTGEKPHACNICDKRFIQIVALRAHLKVHNKVEKN